MLVGYLLLLVLLIGVVVFVRRRADAGSRARLLVTDEIRVELRELLDRWRAHHI